MLSAVENYSEPFQIEDIYVDTLICIEDAADGNTRYVFGASKRGHVETKVYLVSGPTLIWHAIRMTMQHFGKRCCGALSDRVEH